jgi:hypothetical protein
LRERFARVAEGELQKTLDQLARKDYTPVQQREAIQRLVNLVVYKLLHQPTIALRRASPDEAEMRAEILCELFDLQPVGEGEPGYGDERNPEQTLERAEHAIAEPVSTERKAAT